MIGIKGELQGSRAFRRGGRRFMRAMVPKVERALENSAERIRGYVVENLSGLVANVQTENTRRAFQAADIGGDTNRKRVRRGVVWPTRAEFGIDPKAKYYYPTALEYGHGNVAPRPFLRNAIDKHDRKEVRRIGAELGRELTRAGRKAFEKKT